jgi:hypothetical protein
MEALRDAIAHYTDLAKQNRIQSVRVFFNRTGNTHTLSGIMIVEGDLDELRKLQAEQPYQRNLARAALTADNFQVLTCAGGSPDELEEPMTHYSEALATLGLK